MIKRCYIAIALLLVALAGSPCAMAQSSANTVTQLSKPVAEFYFKYLNYGGIAIRSSSSVDDQALIAVRERISMMLSRIPTVKNNLVKWGAEVHVIGKDECTSDLPEYVSFRGAEFVDNLGQRTDLDDRARGLGGIYTSCSEENLLNLPQNRYKSEQDICIHEFAHTIMYYGLNNTLRAAIERQYQKAKAMGLWKDTYAMVDASEYFAELSLWYFGRDGRFGYSNHGPFYNFETLRTCDKEGYALLDRIYSGRAFVRPLKVTPPQKVRPGTPTVGTDGNALFMVTNRTSKKLMLYWVDYDGKPKLHAEVDPYSSFKCDTYLGHVWRLANDKGIVSGWYKMDRPYLRKVIGG